jgi:hypothetical protein
VPPKLSVHVILDNYAVHKHPKVLEWLARHPRFVFHFTPTSASWLNAIEGLFAVLSKRRLKRGVFRLLQETQGCDPQLSRQPMPIQSPLFGQKTPDKIIAAVNEGIKC